MYVDTRTHIHTQHVHACVEYMSIRMRVLCVYVYIYIYICIYIYIYEMIYNIGIYTCILCTRTHVYTSRCSRHSDNISRKICTRIAHAAMHATKRTRTTVELRPIPLLTLSLLTLLDSSFPGNSPWAWEFHPFNLRLCLSQTL